MQDGAGGGGVQFHRTATDRCVRDAMPARGARRYLVKLMSSAVWKGAFGGTNTVLSRT